MLDPLLLSDLKHSYLTLGTHLTSGIETDGSWNCFTHWTSSSTWEEVGWYPCRPGRESLILPPLYFPLSPSLRVDWTVVPQGRIIVNNSYVRTPLSYNVIGNKDERSRVRLKDHQL